MNCVTRSCKQLPFYALLKYNANPYPIWDYFDDQEIVSQPEINFEILSISAVRHYLGLNTFL